MDAIKVARWESARGKYWLELRRDDWGFSYAGNGCGGSLGAADSDEAYARMALELSFWPVKAKRVF